MYFFSILVIVYLIILDHLVYMGKDKYENEELLKYGFPVKFLFKEDLWFHVKDYSSAHVYLRL